MRLFNRALESSEEEEKTIVMKGPLSDIYCQALSIAYAKDNVDAVDVSDAQPDAVPDVAMESASNGKKKTPPKKKEGLDLDVKKNAFHKWLKKEPGEKITSADIEKGLKSTDPHVRRMAQFAKNAKKWQKGKTATEDFDIVSFNNLVMETQQMDMAMLQKLAASVSPSAPTDNFQTVYGVSKDQLTEEDVVSVTNELAKTNQDKSDGKDVDFILVMDAATPKKPSHDQDAAVVERLVDLSEAMECMVLCNGGKVYHSLREFSENR